MSYVRSIVCDEKYGRISFIIDDARRRADYVQEYGPLATLVSATAPESQPCHDP